MAASASGGNRTTEAINVACGGRRGVWWMSGVLIGAQVSAGCHLTDEALRGVYVLGAPEMLQPYLASASLLIGEGD